MTDRLSLPSAPGLAPGAAGPALRVIGLDLSLTSTGIAWPDGTTGRIKTNPKDGDRRLGVIRCVITSGIGHYRPHLAVLEDLPHGARGAAIVAMVHGVVRAALADAYIPYALVSPATLKSFACDHGRADKQQLAAAAHLATGATFIDDKGGDQCDAWWLRAAGHDWYGQPLFDLPAGQRARLSKAKWPSREQVTL